ncbi:MAG: hypothetical protein Kow0032_16620 [Methyloligellaceae bacterium]
MRLAPFALLALLALPAGFVTMPTAARGCTLDCFTETPEEIDAGYHSGGGARAVALAQKYLGTNPTRRKSLWCAEFMNMIERQLGRPGTGSALAKSFAHYGRRVANPRAGDIAVLRRKGGGHVGYVMAVSGNKVKLISGNHGRKVGIGSYPRSRVIAFVRP